MSDRTVLQAHWTWLGGRDVRSGCAVVVEDGRIAAVLDEPPAEGAELVSLPDHLLLPGLINVQTQAGAGALVRGMGEDLSLAEGATYYSALSGVWPIGYREEFRDEWRAIVAWDVYGMLRTGTTTFVSRASVDIEGLLESVARLGNRVYGYPNLPLSVAHRLGSVKDGRAVRSDVVTDMSSELDDFRRLFDRYDNSAGGRVHCILGPASTHTVPPPVLKGVRALADELGCRITIHLAQAPLEVNETVQRYGKTPARVMEETGLLGPDLICAIAAYVDDADLPLLKDHGVYIAHCASRKAKEAITTPYQRYIDLGIPVAIGTDAYYSDLLEEVKTALLLAKIREERIDRPNAADMLTAATKVGADALGRSDLGRLAVGATADVIAVNLASPQNSPVLDPMRMAVYYANGFDVDLVMVGGDVLIRDGRPVFADEAALAWRAQSGAERIWAQAEREGAIPRS
jgi:cytosine/adenosine deaminase-related metal-dependent hydrolase